MYSSSDYHPDEDITHTRMDLFRFEIIHYVMYVMCKVLIGTILHVGLSCTDLIPRLSKVDGEKCGRRRRAWYPLLCVCARFNVLKHAFLWRWPHENTSFPSYVACTAATCSGLGIWLRDRAVELTRKHTQSHFHYYQPCTTAVT